MIVTKNKTTYSLCTRCFIVLVNDIVLFVVVVVVKIVCFTGSRVWMFLVELGGPLQVQPQRCGNLALNRYQKQGWQQRYHICEMLFLR